MVRVPKTGSKATRVGARNTGAPRDRKSAKANRGIASSVIRHKALSVADLQAQLERRTIELDQALERQTATAEILRVISRSPADVRPVFDSIVLAAVRLLHCDRSFFLCCDRTTYSPMSTATLENGLFKVDATRRLPIDPSKNFPSRSIIEKKTLYLPDISMMELPKHERRVYETYGNRSGLFVPLIRGEQCIGLLVFAGKRANAFGEREIALAESFREQALIAIENARLFAEVQTKTRDLQELLQQQTATSEVLQVISSSPGDLAPVFRKMLENATRICGAQFGMMALLEDGLLTPAARYDVPPAFVAARGDRAYSPPPRSVLATAIESKDVGQTADLQTNPAYLEGAQSTVDLVELGGARTVAVVPMLRDNEVIGTITIYRQEVCLFDDKQIELIRNFAKQAVIAIENATLLKELRQRTDDLSEFYDSKPRLRKSCRSSVHLRVSCSRFFRQRWRMLRDFARRVAASSGCGTARPFGALQFTAPYLQPTLNNGRAGRCTIPIHTVA